MPPTDVHAPSALYPPALESLAAAIDDLNDRFANREDTPTGPLLVIEHPDPSTDFVALVEDSDEARADNCWFGWVTQGDFDVYEFTGRIEPPDDVAPTIPGTKLRWIAWVIRARDAMSRELAETGIPIDLHYEIPIHDYEADRALGVIYDELGSMHGFWHRATLDRP